MQKTGENYYYLKTIINNKFKLLKLDLLESAGKILTLLVLGLLLLIFSSFSLIVMLIAFTLFISESMASTQLGLMTSGGILLILGIMIYHFRVQLIHRPLIKIIYNNLYDNNDRSNSN